MLGGVPLRLVDTAGMRRASDPVEQLGVERSLSALEGAQLALLVLDGAQPLTAEDEEAMEQALGGSVRLRHAPFTPEDTMKVIAKEGL